MDRYSPHPRRPSKLHQCGLLFRNILIASCAYAAVVGIVHIFSTRSLSPYSKPTPKTEAPVDGDLSGGVNWKLRPSSLVEDINDGFLGKRPELNTHANYTRLVEACRGSEQGLEKMRDVWSCLQYLTREEENYFYLPEPAEKEEKLVPPTEEEIGKCPGPIQLYHTYWTGPSTWRVEFFIKAYLHTQNLPCSRLHIWLESDTNPLAVSQFLSDPAFSKFLPLIHRGDIILKSWTFPSRIPIPRETIESDPTYSSHLDPTGRLPSVSAETPLGDGIILLPDGSTHLVLTERQKTFLPVAVSDAVRFVVLHIYGGVYLDMDVILLRDMRPLLLPSQHNFAERWGVHTHPGDFNTAIMALTANSSISSYLVRGGVRMGLNFHPRIVGRMAWKDGRVNEFVMLETGLFDPIWGEFNWGRKGRCNVPCFRDYSQAFLGTPGVIKDEWQSYDGPQLAGGSGYVKEKGDLKRREEVVDREEEEEPDVAPGVQETTVGKGKGMKADTTYGGKRYNLEEDKYPPNNRTMENFFRGAWSYHIHNQWTKHPQPNSWFDVLQKAQDGFLARERVNPYGEMWTGPEIAPYDRWREFD